MRGLFGSISLSFVSLFLGAMMLNRYAAAETKAFRIVDDAELSAEVASVREEFMRAHPYLKRLDAVILLPESDGSWRRGAYNPDALAYPASCVKLAYMAATIHYLRQSGRPVNHFDAHLRPMIVHSDNRAVGVIVDAITDAPNYPATVRDAQFEAWAAKRGYTENFLRERGLLDSQVIVNKTYPTNSGEDKNGAEKLLFDLRGRNLMSPKASASLMLEIVKGSISPDAADYMRKLLTHERWDGNSQFGFGLPPGSVYENKWGRAYDTLEDIAHVVLPNKREFILAAFSDGYVAPENANPPPYNVSLLGGFCETLAERLKLDEGCPPKVKVDDKDTSGVVIAGDWTRHPANSTDYDTFGSSYLSTLSENAPSKSVTWKINTPKAGRYEVSVWFPQKKKGGKVNYRIQTSAGESSATLDQRYCGGRWVRLGDYDFKQGEGAVILKNEGKTAVEGQIILADAVKAVRWPD